MGFFKNLFTKKEKEKPLIEESNDKDYTIVSSPDGGWTDGIVTYHPSHCQQKTPKHMTEYDPLVLWWISKKKKGYDINSNKFPKWFLNKYGINFNKVANDYLKKSCLLQEGDIIMISDTGRDELKQKDYVLFVYDHPAYDITVKDIISSSGFGKIQYSDIAWGIFNKRTLEYTAKGMWGSLSLTYANMADLLIAENRYNEALDYIFTTAYIETSGMADNNELAPINDEYTDKKWKRKFLDNGNPDIFLLEINNYNVTNPFIAVQKELNLSDSEIRDRYMSSQLLDSVAKVLPFSYFEKEEAYDFFKEAVDEGEKKGVFPLAKVKKKLKYNKPNERSKKPYFYASVSNKTGIRF